MKIEFTGHIWYWKGPAPHYFVTVPEADCREIKAISGLVTYGWGMIPAAVRIGGSEWTTALFPKDGRYIVPIRANVRISEGLEEGQPVSVQVNIDCEMEAYG